MKSTHTKVLLTFQFKIFESWHKKESLARCVLTLISHVSFTWRWLVLIDFYFTGRRNSKASNRYRNCPFCKQVMVSLEFFCAYSLPAKKILLFTLFLCSDDFLLLTYNRYVAGVLKKIHCVCKKCSRTRKKNCAFFRCKKRVLVREMESEV